MSNIDLSRIVTAEQKHAAALESAKAGAKAECRRRIFAVADQITQMNMANALLTHDAVKSRGASPEEVVAASGLTEQDVATVLTLQPWVAMMKQACAQIALAPGQHLNDDGLWPPAPDGLAALAARF